MLKYITRSATFRAVALQSRLLASARSESTATQEELPPNFQNVQTLDEYTKEFNENRIETTALQKLILTAGSSLAALLDPRR